MDEASQIDSLVEKILENVAPEDGAQFKRDGGLARKALQLSPAQIETMATGTGTSHEIVPRVLGQEATMKIVDLGVSLTVILVHLWHMRAQILEIREKDQMLARLRNLWRDLLINRGVDPDFASAIVSQYGNDMVSMLQSYKDITEAPR
jgi:hypothetical protein